jgi:hypothetical protein
VIIDEIMKNNIPPVRPRFLFPSSEFHHVLISKLSELQIPSVTRARTSAAIKKTKYEDKIRYSISLMNKPKK